MLFGFLSFVEAPRVLYGSSKIALTENFSVRKKVKKYCLLFIILYFCRVFEIWFMEQVKKFRLDFIDVIRAFAICMMLQGHFVGKLLAARYHDENNFIYWLWHYCTGITAPVFFTVSGFIFTFLLVKESDPTKIG